MAAFNELTPVDWAVQILLASPEITALVGDRIDADDDVPEMGENDAPGSYFPRIIYSGTPHGIPWAEAFILGTGDFVFSVVMREDALPPGADLKEYTGQAAGHLETLLTAVPHPELLGSGRTVHGAQVIDVHCPPLYGVRGEKICIRGRVIRLVWS